MENYIDRHNDSQKSFKTIFAYILKKGKTTRREIQNDTNYSWSSVSSVVSVLLNQGLVYEAESSKGKVGRGTSFIVPNGNKYVSIGVDINSTVFSLEVVGIDGSRKYEEKFSYDKKSKAYLLEKLYQAIDSGLAFSKGKYKVISIGVSCQGHVLNHSTFEYFPFCEDELRNLNIKELLESKYYIYTFVEHDTKCIMEDYKTNIDQSDKSVCVCRVVSGIGFAIYLNGQPLEDNIGPVDFGHIIVQPDGALCRCGQKGCLEAYASTTGLTKRAGLTDFSIIQNNRDKYRNLLNDAGYYLGITAANLRRIFDVDSIVFTGIVIENDDEMMRIVKETCMQYVYGAKTQIKYIKDLSAAYGAARLAFMEKNIIGGTFND